MANGSVSSSLFHIILNIISLLMTIFGLIISLFILIIVYLRRKYFYDIKSLLCINNYILIFFMAIVLLIQNIDILRGDFQLLIIEYETFGCRFNGYILFSLISANYQAFILQAVFRLNRIVHRSKHSFIKFRNYLFIIPILWIISLIFVSPLFIFHSHKLISGEHTCFIRKDDSLSILYSMLVIYAIPLICIIFIYIRVSLYLHYQKRLNKNLLIRTNNRDIIVLRRIIILVFLLFSYGLPTSIMLIHLAITNQILSSFYRFLVLSIAACIFTESLAIIYVNPHFRRHIFHSDKTKKISLKNQIKYSQTKTNGTHSNSSNAFEHSF